MTAAAPHPGPGRLDQGAVSLKLSFTRGDWRFDNGEIG